MTSVLHPRRPWACVRYKEHNFHDIKTQYKFNWVFPQDQDKSVSTDAAVQSAIIAYNNLAKEVSEAEIKISSAVLLAAKFKEILAESKDWADKAADKADCIEMAGAAHKNIEQIEKEAKDIKVSRSYISS